MLVLFDIDGTLLTSLRAGLGAMTSTIEELHGVQPDFEGVEIHGRLDRLIWRDLAAKHRLPASEEDHATFKRTYTRHLNERLSAANTAVALPGTVALVDAVRATPGVTIGLLTGNYEATGRLKVKFAGFDPDVFVVNAWGDEGPDRRSLVPVAHERYHQRNGSRVAPERVVILGDTPADVDCAKAHGARVLAVATGGFTAQALAATDADLVVPDLADTAAITRWIVSG
ncbi:MAG: haloacid dehalogenase-like hydrolase [Phycisphaerae bacterium]|nr:haloacid dehalogenase-like hydrolase [Phycisphaerae bacterium]